MDPNNLFGWSAQKSKTKHDYKARRSSAEYLFYLWFQHKNNHFSFFSVCFFRGKFGSICAVMSTERERNLGVRMWWCVGNMQKLACWIQSQGQCEFYDINESLFPRCSHHKFPNERAAWAANKIDNTQKVLDLICLASCVSEKKIKVIRSRSIRVLNKQSIGKWVKH